MQLAKVHLPSLANIKQGGCLVPVMSKKRVQLKKKKPTSLIAHFYPVLPPHLQKLLKQYPPLHVLVLLQNVPVLKKLFQYVAPDQKDPLQLLRQSDVLCHPES